ncbi:MAG: glycine zipper 2TM domain-containing protein [Pseudomonadota bacterium]
MIKRSRLLSVGAISAACLLAACSASNENIGRVTGAVAGGVIGNQFGGGTGRIAATALGALAGGVIGGRIGRSLDQNSRQAALQAEYNALERGAPGQPVRWQGNNGTYGQVVPQQTYQVGSQNCRRYTHTIFIDGSPQQATGTACRNPDGTWTPLS